MSSDYVQVIATVLQTAAVLFGLIFVGVQLRDSRRVAQGGTYQAWLDTMLQHFMALAHTDGLAELYWRGRKDVSSLTEAELPQFFYLCVGYFTLVENLYIQFEDGLIANDVFSAWETGLVEDMSSPGFAEYWRLEASHYNPVFRRFVDGALRAHEGAQSEPSKLSAFWALVNGPSELSTDAGDEPRGTGREVRTSEGSAE